MVVEEAVNSSGNEEEIIAVPRARGSDEEDGELEEGEIVGDADSTSSKQSAGLVYHLHPLEHSWTFWFDSPSAKNKQAAWGSSIRPIYTLATVEEFWGVYNNIHRPSKLAVRADLYCFKYNIEPKWEDPVCANGGKWTVSYQRGKSDNGWLFTLLDMIGEQFDHGDEICGVVVNVRPKEEKVSLWTKNASNKDAQISIGKQWKEFLDYNDSIGFIVHDDAMKYDRSAKNRYTMILKSATPCMWVSFFVVGKQALLSCFFRFLSYCEEFCVNLLWFSTE